jgi:hypothetical protein
VLPRPPIKGEHHPKVHRTSPSLSSLPSTLEPYSHRAPPPPHSAPPSPSLHSAARALVRPEPSSPRSPLHFAPPPVSFTAPERPEAKLRCARHHALYPRRRWSTVDRAHPAGPRIYPLENNSQPKIPRHFAKKPLCFLEINPRSTTFAVKSEI